MEILENVVVEQTEMLQPIIEVTGIDQPEIEQSGVIQSVLTK